MPRIRTRFPLRRGFKPDAEETRNYNFLDRRSYIVRRKDGTLHFILFGKDKEERRIRCRLRAKYKCERCGNLCPITGEDDHKTSGDVHRCDCDANSQWLCTSETSWRNPGCHQGKHPRLGGRTWKQEPFTCPGIKKEESDARPIHSPAE